MHKVLFNFTSNAIKFSSKNGLIELSISVRSRVDEPTVAAPSSNTTVTLEFVVRDHGIDISTEDMQRLFQPFYQIRPGENQMGKGSGLGLNICK